LTTFSTTIFIEILVMVAGFGWWKFPFNIEFCYGYGNVLICFGLLHSDCKWSL
jgi:hypothetical protein